MPKPPRQRLATRSGKLVVYLRRRRKRVERGPLSEREAELLTALVEAEGAAKKLRELLPPPRPAVVPLPSARHVLADEEVLMEALLP